MTGDAALPRVNAHTDASGKAAAHLLAPNRIEQSARAENYSLDAPAERFGDVILIPQTAAKLTRDAGRLHDAPHTVAVYRMSLARAVEIDQMKKGCSLLAPVPRHGGGIVAEDGFLSIIALPQPHALAAAQIDGRQDQHGREPPIGTRTLRATVGGEGVFFKGV